MHNHINIKVNGSSMTLPADFSLDITEENPVFHDNGMHSDPVRVPMEGNRKVFQNMDDPKSSLRPVSMEHLPAEITISGIPFRNGTVVIQEDEELDGYFAFNIDESAQSFQDLIGDLKCQDVPLYDNELIPVGQKICDVNITGKVHKSLYFALEDYGDVNDQTAEETVDFSTSFNPQALGFSYPGVATKSSAANDRAYPEGIVVHRPNVQTSYINVTEPYQSREGRPMGWRYCNARICYEHHGLDATDAADDLTENGKTYVGTIGKTVDETVDSYENFGNNEDYGPLWVLDADRPQSGICFYVLYFLDCLFHHLGVSFDNSALTAIEDLRRLCFFTTHCRYMTDSSVAVQTLSSIDAINEWAEDRGCGGRIEVREKLEKTQVQQAKATVGGVTKTWHIDDMMDWSNPYSAHMSGRNKIVRIDASGTIDVTSASASVRTMYATNENFPDESVSAVISSLEASFGIRFRYDYQRRRVTAYLLRDVFRQKDDDGNAMQPITLPCTVLAVNKVAEKITGVRMKYSAESDSREQMENIRRAKRDYETDFDYMDYRQGRTKVSDGYRGIVNDLRTENLTCYVDRLTGNAFRFKIAKEVTSADVKYHRLFEVGQFHGIEVGDCSKMNENNVKELVSDFQPMSWNDVNAREVIKGNSNRNILAAFVDEDMEHEFVTQKLAHPLYTEDVEAYAHEVLRLVESYDPTGTDDGNSPLQTAEWGLAIAIMRGGGADAKIQNYSRNYDGFDNSKWRQVAGEYAMSSDSMDQFGNTFDYNGDGADGEDNGDGGGERFSLKIRSWKPFLYYEKNGQTVVTGDLTLLGKPVEGETGKVWLRPCVADAGVCRRGLADVFMSEYIWFLLHRRKLRIHCLMEPAVLIDIPNHWQRLFTIGHLTGYIDKMSYSVSGENGVGEVTIDFFAI